MEQTRLAEHEFISRETWDAAFGDDDVVMRAYPHVRDACYQNDPPDQLYLWALDDDGTPRIISRWPD